MTELICYSKVWKAKIDAFMSLPPDQRYASYWDDNADAEIITLKHHIKTHYLHVQDYTCAYCRQRIEVQHHSAWDTDHVIAKATHPQFMFDALNLCVSCKDCNAAKQGANVLVNPRRKTLPRKKDDYIICHPHLDIYYTHITILSTAEFYVPRTKKGRKTIEICGLLRFVYKFANYRSTPEDVKRRIGEMHTELMRATTPIEEAFWLECIRDAATTARSEKAAKSLSDRGI